MSHWSCPRRLFVLAGLLVAAGVLGCGHRPIQPPPLPVWVFDTNRHDHPPPRAGIRGRSEASDFVVAALQGAGLRFGTDGTVRSLWQYLRSSHQSVSPTTARPGDIVLFRVAPGESGDPIPCDAPDRVGIVSAVDPQGKIGFVEARDGRKLTSYVDPIHPSLRRDADGNIHNSFLRPVRAGDPFPQPLLAGETLCAISRPWS